MIDLAPQQTEALNRVRAWLEDPFAAGVTQEAGVFRLFGHAGSGKSTLAKQLVASVAGVVRYGAFTGKAALVMHQKGCIGATTIHRLIYLPRGKCEKHLRELAEKMRAETDPDRRRELALEHEEEKKNLARPSWSLNLDSPLRDAALLVLDECFPVGTLVDTPRGPRPIEQLCPGDGILNAAGADRIVATKKKEVSRVIRICAAKTPDIFVSERHPFFTARGLVRADQLRPGDRLLRTVAAVRLLRDCDRRNQTETASSLLFACVRDALVDAYSRKAREIAQRGGVGALRSGSQSLLAFRLPGGGSADRSDSETESRIASGGTGQDIRKTQGGRVSASCSGRQWPRPNGPGICACPSIAGNVAWADSASRIAREGLSDALQVGFGRPGTEAVHRAGRWISLSTESAGAGSEEGREAAFTRVDCVEILEQGDPRLDCFRDAGGKLYFYDLQAARHQSFSVAGLLVHNCSMIGREIGADLLSFKVPILALGDPAQLPPVKDRGYFTDPRQKADFLLTEIHRQAAGSPVLHLATLARRGEPLPYGEYGTSRVLRRREMSLADALANHDQIIVGRNATRRALNAKARAHLGFGPDPLPAAGERLVCLRNDHEVGLLNGSQWTCLGSERIDDDRASLSIIDEQGTGLQVESHLHYFRGEEPPHYEVREAQCFDFSYAVTCHKAQGSQWPRVCVVDESDAFQAEARRWLYTAVTRAAETVTVVR